MLPEGREEELLLRARDGPRRLDRPTPGGAAALSEEDPRPLDLEGVVAGRLDATCLLSEFEVVAGVDAALPSDSLEALATTWVDVLSPSPSPSFFSSSLNAWG